MDDRLQGAMNLHSGAIQAKSNTEDGHSAPHKWGSYFVGDPKRVFCDIVLRKIYLHGVIGRTSRRRTRQYGLLDVLPLALCNYISEKL